jgi:nucleotide-binding universal stress UspA family protein
MKILLCVDDSKFSQAALRMLVEQNNPRKTTVRVLHVVEPLETPYYPELSTPYPTNLGEIQKGRMKVGRELVEDAVKKLRAAGFKAEGVARAGHVRTLAVDVAKKGRADLIVVGSHGRKGLKRILLGSVSDHIVRHAPCSVEIVRTRTKGN